MELFLHINEHFTSHFLGRCLHITSVFNFDPPSFPVDPKSIDSKNRDQIHESMD